MLDGHGPLVLTFLPLLFTKAAWTMAIDRPALTLLFPTTEFPQDRALEKEISELGKELDQLSVDLGREEKLLDDLRANDKERTLRDKLAGDVAVKQAVRTWWW